MGIIGTLHYPNSDLWGPFSLVALGFAAAAWVVVDHGGTARVRTGTLYGVLVGIAVFLMFSSAPVAILLPVFLIFPGRFFPDAQDYFGNYILMTVGLVLAYRTFQLDRRCGAIVLVLFGLMVFLELVLLLVRLMD